MITLLPCLIGCILLWKVPKTNIGAALAGIYMNVSEMLWHIPQHADSQTVDLCRSVVANPGLHPVQHGWNNKEDV